MRAGQSEYKHSSWRGCRVAQVAAASDLDAVTRSALCPVPIHDRSIAIYSRDCELGANIKDSRAQRLKATSPTFETCITSHVANQRPRMAREFRNSDPLSQRARTCCRGRRLLPHGEHQSPNRSPGHEVLMTARPTFTMALSFTFTVFSVCLRAFTRLPSFHFSYFVSYL